MKPFVPKGLLLGRGFEWDRRDSQRSFFVSCGTLPCGGEKASAKSAPRRSRGARSDETACSFVVVGSQGFEPWTTATPRQHSTKLNYDPFCVRAHCFFRTPLLPLKRKKSESCFFGARSRPDFGVYGLLYVLAASLMSSRVIVFRPACLASVNALDATSIPISSSTSPSASAALSETLSAPDCWRILLIGASAKFFPLVISQNITSTVLSINCFYLPI